MGDAIRDTKNNRVNRPKKVLLKGHEFKLIFNSDSKNKAKREARKNRKKGFHTRVRELYLGLFCVYRRPKKSR